MLKVGFVGWGNFSENHAKYFKKHSSVSIKAICGTRRENQTRSEQRRRKLGLEHVPIYFSETNFDKTDTSIIQEVLEKHSDINALVISTPHTMHYSQAKFGLENNLNILLDKPLAVTYKEAKILVNLARERNRIFIVANQRRYEDTYNYVAEMIQSEQLGDIMSINGILSHRRTWLNGWYKNLELSGGGVIFSIGHHLIDTLVWLLQDKASEINAYALYLEDDELEVYVDALIRFKRGCSATIVINHGAPENAVYERLQIWASKGNITIDRFRPKYDTEPAKVIQQNINGEIVPVDFSSIAPRARTPAQDFVEAIIKGKSTVSSGAQNLVTMQVIDALYKSIRTKKRVKL